VSLAFNGSRQYTTGQMRSGGIAFAAVIAVLPAIGQQPDPAPATQGIVNEQALRDAIMRALTFPKMPPVVDLPPLRPPKVVMILPPVMCAVPLIEVPISGEPDKAILHPESAISRDPKMPIASAVPSCGDIKSR
jgi:hypothetical protein